jgi:integrase
MAGLTRWKEPIHFDDLPTALFHFPCEEVQLFELAPRADMLPRYLTDQELRTILAYCGHDASPFERTMVITLLHTGIRAMEFSLLKASDMKSVQIA